MPELPEVEVVKKSLENIINKLIVKDVKINDPNLRYKVKRQAFKQIIGLKITAVKRRSKYLLFFFNNNLIMIVHLGMTGKFFIKKKEREEYKTSFYYEVSQKNKKHDHIVFTFTNQTKLIYNDVRKFGFFKFTNIEDLKKNSHLELLGPEPLNNYFNVKYFKKYIHGKNRFIKNLLMDQKFVSGLGNIYVNEILFYSGINPKRKISNLKNLEIKKIIENTKKILKKAIKYGGSSIKNFSNTGGQTGSFQQHFGVYGMFGNKCSNVDCNRKIEKTIISNRSSFFCRNCQK